VASQVQREQPSALLGCRLERRGTTRIVCVDGEIDLSTVSELRDAIGAAFDDDSETVVVDLSGVTFMDSTGLHALIDADRRSHAGGIRLVIVEGSALVHGPFRKAGLDAFLPFVGPAREVTDDGCA
jgi:anti-anti-sigma factor